MKAIIIVTACLLLATPALAIDGELSFGFTFGHQQYYVTQPMGYGRPVKFETTVEIGHTFNFDSVIADALRPYFSIKTRMDEMTPRLTFHPGSVEYEVGLQIDKRLSPKYTVFCEVSHTCWHGVDSWAPVSSYNIIRMGFKF